MHISLLLSKKDGLPAYNSTVRSRTCVNQGPRYLLVQAPQARRSCLSVYGGAAALTKQLRVPRATARASSNRACLTLPERNRRRCRAAKFSPPRLHSKPRASTVQFCTRPSPPSVHHSHSSALLTLPTPNTSECAHRSTSRHAPCRVLLHSRPPQADCQPDTTACASTTTLPVATPV